MIFESDPQALASARATDGGLQGHQLVADEPGHQVFSCGAFESSKSTGFPAAFAVLSPLLITTRHSVGRNVKEARGLQRRRRARSPDPRPRPHQRGERRLRDPDPGRPGRRRDQAGGPGVGRGEGGTSCAGPATCPGRAHRHGADLLTINRNKRSILLDMNRKRQRAIRRLIKTCDVFAASGR